MRARAVVAMGLPLLGVGMACEALVGIDEHRFEVPPPPDVVDPCVHVGPPGPPDADLTDDSNEPTLVFAFSGVDTTARQEDGTPLGFDLDDTCSCSPLAGTKHDGGFSCTPPGDPAEHCDGDGGIDNALAMLADSVSNLLTREELDSELRCGETSILLLLNDYNRLPDDAEVTVQVIESTGLRFPRPDDSREGAVAKGCSPNGDFMAYPARYDGLDRWSTPVGLIPDAAGPRIEARAATFRGWVSGYHLVLDRGGEDLLPLFVAGRYLRASRPRVSAKLTPLDANGTPLPLGPDGLVVGGAQPARYALEGIIAGRASPRDILTAVGNTNFGSSEWLCQRPELYAVLKGLVCGAPDTKFAPREDFLPGPCDAVSIGARFYATAALIGDPADRRDSGLRPCAPELFEYSCD